jgi:hypothetical protein
VRAHALALAGLLLVAPIARAGLLDTPAPILPDGAPATVIYRMGPVFFEPGNIDTVIRCANLGQAPVGLEVEIFDESDQLVASATSANLAVGADVAFGTSADRERPDLVIIGRLVNLQQGKARVSATDTKISCLGQQVLHDKNGTSRVLGLELVKKVAF